MSVFELNSGKVEDHHNILKIMKNISSCQGHHQLLQIDEENIISCLKNDFGSIINENSQDFGFIKDPAFYPLAKAWAGAYTNLAAFLTQNKQQNSNSLSILSHLDSNQHKNDSSQQEVNKRKATRLFHAMRNVKNRQQLKKDQIFIRLIPRSQNCIQFMLTNRNFPRIQLKLSCNQHLQYLVNYLTNKWLRGKVGVGHQIVLYPDPGSYLKKNKQTQQKRQQIIHEPLNNYLMFTDIMTGYGASQNACINLYYDITELRKQKHKIVHKEKQSYFSEQKNNEPALQRENKISIPRRNLHSFEINRFRNDHLTLEKKIEQNAQQLLQNSYDDHSLNLNLKNYHKKFDSQEEHYDQNSLNPRHIPEEEDYGSFAYNWNAFNSNLLAGSNHMMFNNSNTFLNHQNLHGMGPIHHASPIKNNGQARIQDEANQIKQPFRGSPEKSHRFEGHQKIQENLDFIQKIKEELNESQKSEKAERGEKSGNLDNLRNFINMIQMEVPIMQEGEQKIAVGDEKEQNSVNNQRSNSNFPIKEIKTVKVIKKKGGND